MTCLEAQSNIMAFIEGKLPDDKAYDFVRHMKYCHNCFEELEIYYTLIEGMRQLDESEELSHNFTNDLNYELDKLANKFKHAKRAKISSFSIALVVAVSLLIIFYNQCLGKVYNIEQSMLEDRQGDNFFYDHFSEYIDFDSKDIISDLNKVEEIPDPTIYEIIHYYNIKHINETDIDTSDSD